MKKSTTSSLSGQKSSLKTFRNKSVRHKKEKRNKKRGTQKKRGGWSWPWSSTDEQILTNLQKELTDLKTKSQGISNEPNDSSNKSIQSVESQISELEKKIAQKQVPTKPADAQSGSTSWFSSLFGSNPPVPAKTSQDTAKTSPVTAKTSQDTAKTSPDTAKNTP